MMGWKHKKQPLAITQIAVHGKIPAGQQIYTKQEAEKMMNNGADEVWISPTQCYLAGDKMRAMFDRDPDLGLDEHGNVYQKKKH